MQPKIQETWKKIAEHFDSMTNGFMYDFKKQNARNILIIAHGDLDGIVSAGMIYYAIKDVAKNIETIFSLPKWIGKWTETADIYDFIFVVDLAVNNRDPKPAQKFIQTYSHKLMWIDHHEAPDTKDFDGIIADTSYKSCAYLLKDLLNTKFPARIENLIELAHETDQGYGQNIYNKALKINQKNDESRYEIYRLMNSLHYGVLYKKSYRSLKRKAEYYDQNIKETTLQILEERSKVIGNVVYIDTRFDRYRRFDPTLLAMRAYKKAPIVIRRYFGGNFPDFIELYESGEITRKEKDLLFKWKNTEGQNGIPKKLRKYLPEEILKISRVRDLDIDLLKLFDLESGPHYIVTLREDFSKEIIQKINSAYNDATN